MKNITFFIVSSCTQENTFSIRYDEQLPQARLATEKLTESLEEAISHLEKAAEHWGELVQVTEPVYKPMPLTHLNEAAEKYFHWSNYQEEVEADIEIARNAP